MEINKTMTASVYVVYDNKVLLHRHKKYNTLFPLGGKINYEEVPHETAIREVFEESGLEIELYNKGSEMDLERVIKLHSPMHILLENVGHEVENIDFIYFAIAKNNKLNPQVGESKELFWFTKKEIENNKDIKQHVKAMALDSLDKLKK